MFARIVGLVDEKRKRRSDGCVCLTVHIVELQQVTDSNAAADDEDGGGGGGGDVLPDDASNGMMDGISRRKTTHLLLSPINTQVAEVDLEFCTKGAYVEGFGRIVHGTLETIGGDAAVGPGPGPGPGGEQEEGGQGLKSSLEGDEQGQGHGQDSGSPSSTSVVVALKALAVLRISPFPAQLKQLLRRASSLSSPPTATATATGDTALTTQQAQATPAPCQTQHKLSLWSAAASQAGADRVRDRGLFVRAAAHADGEATCASDA